MSGRFDDELTGFFGEALPFNADVTAYVKAIEDRHPPDTKNVEEGIKHDQGKLDYTLLPFKALEEVVEVLGFGTIKYGRNNWQKVERQRYVAAAFRHLIAIAKGEVLDEESGKSHAAHLTCCSLFLGELGSS